MYVYAFIKMGYTSFHLTKVNTPLVEFMGIIMVLEGFMRMCVEFRIPLCVASIMVNILIVNVYNVKRGRKTLYGIGATIFIPYLKIKFSTLNSIEEESGDRQISRDCYVLSLKGKSDQVNHIGKHQSLDLKGLEATETQSNLEPVDEVGQVEIKEERTINVEKDIQGVAQKKLISFYESTRMYFIGLFRICFKFLERYSSISNTSYPLPNLFDKRRETWVWRDRRP
jgi:hypothetical protein